MAFVVQRYPYAATRRAATIPAALTDILAPFLASRLLFVVLTLSSSWWIGLFHLPTTPPLMAGHGIDALWFRWDAQWYARVATDGYSTVAYAHDHLNLAFFPLYPAMLHLWLVLWPGNAALAGMAIANLCFGAASYYLYQLVLLDHGRSWARRVVWLFALFPTSLFFFAGYSEALFLLCLILCFYRLRLRQWWLAGLYGGLAAATRPLGIVVVVPFLICFMQAHGGSAALRPWLNRHRQALLGALAIPCGLLGYMLYLWSRFGNPLAFSGSQRSWHRTWAWPWQTLGTAVTRPFAHFPRLSTIEMHAITDTIWGIVFLAITVAAARALPRHYTVFLWLFWLVVLSTPALLDDVPSPLISLPRFLLTAFPLLIYLAGDRRRFLITCAMSVPLLAFNTAIFVSGRVGRLDQARWSVLAPGALIAYSVLWRLPMLGDPPWLNDEGTYATVGRAITQSEALYRQIWENKPPAVYLLYGAVHALLGPDHLLVGVRLLALLAALIAQTAVYRLARRALSPTAALLAAAVAGAGLDLPILDGTAANAEIFMAACTAAGMALLWKGLLLAGSRSGGAWLFGAGLAFGTAMMCKLPAGADLAAALAALVATRTGERVRGMLALLAGTATAPALAALWLLKRGVLGDAIYATIGYNRGYVATGQQHSAVPAIVLFAIPLTAIAVGVALAFRGAGERAQARAAADSPPRFFAACTGWWLGAALIGALASGRLYPHYALQAVPPLAIIAALLLQARARLALAILLIGWTVGVPLYSLSVPRGDRPGELPGIGQPAYYVNALLHASGAIDDATYAYRLDPRVTRNLAVVRYLAAHPAGPKRLYIWGNAPWIYYLSGYQHAARFVSAYYNPPIPGGDAVVLQALSSKPPPYVVVMQPRQPSMPGLARLLQARYRRIWAGQGAAIYRLR